jgi:hypothetical protein
MQLLYLKVNSLLYLRAAEQHELRNSDLPAMTDLKHDFISIVA